MKPEYEGLLRSVNQWSRWTYKDKEYVVMTVTPGLLSQDPDGEWTPTVIYSVYNAHHDTQVVGALEYRFARPITEFVKKFTRVVEKKKVQSS